MKKLCLILLMMASAQYSFSQTLSAVEMLTMLNCKDYNCISEQVIPLGYDITLNKETEGYKNYIFSSKQIYQNGSNVSITLPYRIEFTVRTEDKSVTLNHAIGNKEIRESLLEDFKKAGFEYVRATRTNSNFDNAATEYKSPSFPNLVLKVTNYEKKDKKRMYLEYDFELWRPLDIVVEKKPGLLEQKQ